MFAKLKLRKRLIKTLDRFRFKAYNPKSKMYGYFEPVKITDTPEYKEFHQRPFIIREYKDKFKVVFLVDYKKQMEIKTFTTLLISRKSVVEKYFEKTDEATNNFTN
jgi:hypothetical protein